MEKTTHRMARWFPKVSFRAVLFFSLGQICSASDLVPFQTPSTGYQPQFQGHGKKLYFVWHEYDGPFRQIFTAEMNADGTKWKATRRTSSPFDKLEPQFHSIGEKMYFVWRESDGSHFQIWTGTMNRDGTGWEAVKRTGTTYDKHNPRFQLAEGKIFFAWHQSDRSDFRRGRYQIWTAKMSRDGTEWQATQRTVTPFDKSTPQLQVYGEIVNYVWEESDGKYRQIWTAGENRDGTGWKSQKRTKSLFGKYDPQLQILGGKAYYVWHEDHGPTEPIWVAIEILD